ncbi:hypothetical protein Tco_0673120 [Tanacetum coccineum]
MTANRIDVIELACEEYSQEVLGFSDSVAYGNPSPDYEFQLFLIFSPTLKSLSGESDFFLLEEKCHFIAINDEPISRKLMLLTYDPEEISFYMPIPFGKNVKTGVKTPICPYNWARKAFYGKEGINSILRSETKKEAENLAADHLSRIENPHQNEFENKEITETFPLETLGSVALCDDNTPWFADFANYHAGNFIGKKLLTSSKLAIVDPPGDTTVPITPLKRSSIQDFISPRSTRMPMTLLPDVTFVNVKAKFRNVMRCHKTLSKFAKSLTFGALILWGRSRLQEGTNIILVAVDSYPSMG